MGNKKNRFMTSLVVLVVCLSAVFVVTSAMDRSIGELYRSIYEKHTNDTAGSDSSIVASVNGIDITVEQFKLEKAGMTFMQEYSGYPVYSSDHDIIQRIAETELALAYADEVGISISETELQEYVKENRRGIERSESEEAMELLHAIMEARGLDENSYWQDAHTLNQYRTALTDQKIAAHLLETGQIDSISDYLDWKRTLLDEERISINKEVLDELNKTMADSIY